MGTQKLSWRMGWIISLHTKVEAMFSRLGSGFGSYLRYELLPVVDLIRRSIITLLDHFLLGPHLQIHTCWISVRTGSFRHILAPLYLPTVAAAVGTVCLFPPHLPF